MCEGERCASELAARLQEGDTWDVLKILGQDGPLRFEPTCVRELLDILLPLLDDSNPLTRWHTHDALEQLARDQPMVVADRLKTITERVGLVNDDASGVYARTLLELAETAPEQFEELPLRHLKHLCEADDGETRAIGARLLRYHASRAAIELLQDMHSYEIAPVDEAVSGALTQRRDDALARLSTVQDGEGGPKVLAAVGDLTYLARELPDFILEESERFKSLFGTPEGESGAEILGRALAKHTDSTIVDRLHDYVDIDPYDSPQTRKQAEHGLIALAEAGRTGSLAAPLVSNCRSWLATDVTEVREHALTQLRTLAESNPETVESQLSEIGASVEDDPALSALVGEVLRNLGKAKGGDAISYLQTVLEGRNDSSAVNHLIETAGALRYRPPGESAYVLPKVGRLTAGALENLHEAVATERSTPVVWPTFEPQLTVLLTIELLLGGLNDGSDVVLFSPGSGNHWGNKTEIRDEYARYGIEVSSGQEIETVSLPAIVPHARIGGSGIKVASGGEAESRLVITKRLDELEAIDSPDVVLLNLTSRTKEEFDSAIDDVMERFGRSSVIPLYSNMTKHEFEHRAPRFGPPADVGEVDTLPDVDTLEAAYDTPSPSEAGLRAQLDETDTLFAGLLNPAPVKVVGVDDYKLVDMLDAGYEASTELRETGQKRVSGRVFSKLMMLERFPLPVERYESWVYEQRQGGGLYGPRTLQSTIDGLQTYASRIEDTSAASKVFKTTEHLGYARNKLLDENPMYDSLCSRLKDALASGDKVAIFMPKATWQRAVRDFLLEEEVITQQQLDEGVVQIVKPDSARTLDSCDELIVVGPQRPQYSFIYLHPRVGQTTILTYRAEWDWMVERNVQQFVERLNDAAAGIDYNPYTAPTMTVEQVDNPSWMKEQEGFGTVQTTDQDGSTNRASQDTFGSDRRQDAPESGRTGARDDRRALAELFDIAGDSDYGDTSGGRYDGYERREFRVEATSGETFDRRSRVIRHRDVASSKGRHHWVSPSALSPGDTIVVLDETVFRELWDEWLTKTYTESLGDTNAFEHLDTWHSMVSSILETAMKETGADSPTDPAVRRWILRQTTSIDRWNQTIWGWFTSVAAADSPLELAQDSDLTMGPQQAEDIEAIARIFERPEIDEDSALVIEESLNRIRGANASQGHEFRESIRDNLNELDSNRVSEAAKQYEVKQVTEL